jgi:SAM-dependent methyltransferase
MPEGDRTPVDFDPKTYFRQSPLVMKWIRRWLYPPLGSIATPFLRRVSEGSQRLPDSVLWNQRGNDFEAKRRRVNDFCPIRGKDVLAGGCGMGKDIPTWLPFHPTSVMGVDYFRYDRAWDGFRKYFSSSIDDVRVSFRQSDLRRLPFPPSSFDIVSTDAVFEHCYDLKADLQEMCRVVRPEGVIYATFGPIYTAFGGDHFSGRNELKDAFNHLLLTQEEYLESINRVPYNSSDPQEDGRTWIKNGLFSFLRYDSYISLFLDLADILFLQLILDPRAFRFKRLYPQHWDRLVRMGLFERDLVVMGMTVILKPKPLKS